MRPNVTYMYDKYIASKIRARSLNFASPLAFNVRDRGVPWDDLRKILHLGLYITGWSGFYASCMEFS